MHIAYLIYQAERPRSAAERRAEDVGRGELAKSLSRVLRGHRRPKPGGPAAAPAVRPAVTAVPAARVPAQRDHRTACRPA